MNSPEYVPKTPQYLQGWIDAFLRLKQLNSDTERQIYCEKIWYAANQAELKYEGNEYLKGAKGAITHYDQTGNIVDV